MSRCVSMAEVVWVGVHPCRKIRLTQHQKRVHIEWLDNDWVAKRLRNANCEDAGSFGHWTGAVDILGCITIHPQFLIDELTQLDAEQNLLWRCPSAFIAPEKIPLRQNLCKKSPLKARFSVTNVLGFFFNLVQFGANRVL